METDDEPAQMAYAHALAHWGDVGGYDAEVTWDTVTVAALGVPYEQLQVPRAVDAVRRRAEAAGAGGAAARPRRGAAARRAGQLPRRARASGGWRSGCWRRRKTVLFVSHDRELLARVADRVVTVEGGTAWVHGGGFASYHEARTARHERHGRAAAAVGRGAPAADRPGAHPAAAGGELTGHGLAATARCRPGWRSSRPPARRRTGRRSRRWRCGCAAGAPACARSSAEQLELTGLMQPFDAEIFYGDRVGVLGANGAGQVALPAAAGRPARWRTPASAGSARASSPGSSPRPTPIRSGRTARRSTCSGTASRAGPASTAAGRWRRCAATGSPSRATSCSGTLSGGQQARFQILLLELSGATLLLLDEPTDNLDVLSAEALEEALGAVRRHGAGGHPRPLVRPLVRPVPGVRRRRPGLRVGRAGVRRDPGPARPLNPRSAERAVPSPAVGRPRRRSAGRRRACAGRHVLAELAGLRVPEPHPVADPQPRRPRAAQRGLHLAGALGAAARRSPAG